MGQGRGACCACCACLPQWCVAVQSECTFNGAWGGSKAPAVFYISSYFWDRATDVGLIPDDKSISVVISPSDFRSAVIYTCTANPLSMDHRLLTDQDSRLPLWLCLSLSLSLSR